MPKKNVLFGVQNLRLSRSDQVFKPCLNMRQARRGDTNTNGFECYPGCSVYSIAYVKDEQWNFAPW